MNPNVYQAAAARTECSQDKAASRMESLLPVDPNSPDSLHFMPVRINHAIVGLAGEVGELAQLLERWVYYGQSLSVPDVEEEVGDCLWYIALLCTAVGIPMERAMESNIAKLKARFPHKFTEEAAANRDTAAERKASDEALENVRVGVNRYGEPGMPPRESCVVLPGGISVPDVWVCECGQLNADRRIVCGWCNKRRKGHEDWACECSHINLAVDPRCAKCEKPRVAESIAPQQLDPVSHKEDSAPNSRPPDQSNPFGYDEAGEFEDL